MARVIGIALLVVGSLTMNPFLRAAGTLLLTADSVVQSRREKRRARAAANDALQDRLQMANVTADAPRTVVLGRVRTVEGLRRPPWTSGNNSEKLTMIVSFAGHEIDGFEQFYFDDVPLTLDAGGYVSTAPYLKGRRETGSEFGTANAAGVVFVELPFTPLPGTVNALQREPGGEGNGFAPAVVLSVTGAMVEVQAEPGALITVLYEYSVGTSTARIRTYTGTAAQNVGADLAAEYPGKISASDRFAGIALAVVDLTYDPDIYPQGIPRVTAVLRGARCYDPRRDSTQPGGTGAQRLADPATWTWTENPALHALHWAMHPNGWAVPAAELRMPDFAAAADVCDVPTNFTLRDAAGVASTVTLPRHRSGMVLPLADADPRELMDDIMQAMAGRWGWAGGQLRMRAGAVAASSFTVTPEWLAVPVPEDGAEPDDALVTISNGVSREERINRVSGVCVDPAQRWQPMPYPAVQDASLIAARGLVATEADLAAVSHIAHAQHLGTVRIREAQASLRVQASCNLRAWPVELFDIGTLQLPRYGFAGNLVEVQGWRWHPSLGVLLRLAETSPDIYTPVAELTGRDPAPNSTLPRPWQVEQPQNVAVTSGTATLTDGSVLTRTRVTWQPAVSQSVRSGGKVQLEYAEVQASNADPVWQLWEEDGAASAAVIPALRARYGYLFRVRFQTASPLRVRGDWSVLVTHIVAAAPASAGPPGEPGVQAAQAYLYQWATAQPANPTGTSLFTWANGAHTAYSVSDGWSTTAPANPGTPGLRLWVAARQALAAANATSTVLSWAAGVSIAAWGQNGNAGAPGAAGSPGAPGAQSAVVYLYQWAGSQPPNPAGSSTFTWATAVHSAYLGGNGWALDVPDNPGTPGARLWVAKKGITDTSGAVSSTVSWASGYSVAAWAGNGAAGAPGAPGIQAAQPTVYRWAASLPTISGTSSYTWATGTLNSAPAGWALQPGAGSPGQTLFGASVSLVDSAGVATTLVNWATAGISPRGYAGTDGAAGPPGAPGSNGMSGISARRAYTLTTATALGTGTVTTSGINSLPPANSVFGSGLGWAAQPGTPAVGQTLYQSDGLYNPATDQVIWETPYISALKVGSLSALSVNTGNLQVNGELRMPAEGQLNAGAFVGYAWPTGLGGGFHLGPLGLLLGNPLGNKFFQVTAAGEIYTPAFSVTDAGVVINVSMNPNGTLNNGVGGQVTLPGLGYTGDLNATFGATPAQAAAITAATAAIAAIANDAILSRGEKPDVILRWQEIDGQAASLGAQGTTFGLTAERDAFNAAYVALANYLGSLSPPWFDVGFDSPIVGADFRAAFVNLYTARQVLLNAIDAASRSLALAAQGTANNALAGLDLRLRNDQRNVLAGGAGLAVGSITWSAAGAYTGGAGVAITSAGILGHDGTAPFFVLSPAGLAVRGDITGSTGTFAGSIVVGTAAIAGTTMSGSGAAILASGAFVLGTASRNIAFNGTDAPRLNGQWVTEANLALTPVGFSISPSAITDFTTSTGLKSHGTATASVPTGTGPFTFAWAIANSVTTNGTGQAQVFISSYADGGRTIGVSSSGLVAGAVVDCSITCTATDANGRSNTATLSVSINRP